MQELNSTELVNLAAKAALAKNAETLVALDVSERLGFADAFLIASGEVERSVQAISDEVEDTLNEQGIRTLRREGRESGRWVLLDFGDLIVHIFHREDREFYDLERLWQDCPKIVISEDALGLPQDHKVR